MLHIGLKQDLYQIRTGDTFTAPDYTRAFKWLFPSGIFWNFLQKLIGPDILQDTITGNGEQIDDEIDNGTYEVYQDTINQTVSTNTDSKWGDFVSCFAGAVYRFQNTTFDVYRESIPGLSKELTPDWMQQAGVTGEVYDNYPWSSEEEKALYTHYRLYLDNYWGLTVQWYEAYALELGYTIVLEEFTDIVNHHYIKVNINSGNNAANTLNRLKNDLLLFKGSHMYFDFINNL